MNDLEEMEMTMIIRSAAGTVEANLGLLDSDELQTLFKISSAINTKSDQRGEPTIVLVRTTHAFEDAMCQGLLDWPKPTRPDAGFVCRHSDVREVGY